MVDHHLAIELDGDALADHADLEAIPLAKGLVHALEGMLALFALVVPKAA